MASLGTKSLSFGGKKDKKKSKKQQKKEKEEAEAAAEKAIKFSEEEMHATEEDQQKKLDEELMLPSDLMRMVADESTKHAMSLAQSVELMGGAIMDFHEENKSVASMQEVLQLTRKVNFRTKGMKGFLKSSKPQESDIQRFGDFTEELGTFVDEVLEERARVAAEIEQLVAVKQDLLSQLSQMPGEQWRKFAGESAAAAAVSEPPVNPRQGPPPTSELRRLPSGPVTGASRPIPVATDDPFRFVDEPAFADEQWEDEGDLIEEDRTPLAPTGSFQYASVDGGQYENGYRSYDQQSERSASLRSASQVSGHSFNNGHQQNFRRAN